MASRLYQMVIEKVFFTLHDVVTDEQMLYNPRINVDLQDMMNNEMYLKYECLLQAGKYLYIWEIGNC